MRHLHITFWGNVPLKTGDSCTPVVEKHKDVAPTRCTEPCELNDLLVQSGVIQRLVRYMWCGAMYVHVPGFLETPDSS